MNLSVDDNNDLLVENNNFVMTIGAEEIKQLIKQRLGTFFGEVFTDSTKGVPYFQQILKKQPNPSVVVALIQKQIIETDGVLELLTFEHDYSASARSLSITYEVRVEDDPDSVTFVDTFTF